jgi:hypothetical protein
MLARNGPISQSALAPEPVGLQVQAMTKLVTILQMIARLLGVVQILLGLAIWLGFATGIVPVHSAIGSLFVLDVWVIAVIALFALDRRTLPLLVLALGGIVLWFGMAQTTLLVGQGHWAVRLLHLLLGLALLGLAESLGKAVRIHKSRSPE